jgi:probable F420-dependent oxidoreductase
METQQEVRDTTVRRVGNVGIWSGLFATNSETAREAAVELDRLGYGTLWLPNRPGLFDLAQALLDATEHLVVATGIASIWTHSPEEVAAAHHALTQAYPQRFLLGLGVSHAHVVDREQAGRYSRPVERMATYLDALDVAPMPVPANERILAALGPRMLTLARERSAGAHPYLVTVEHTRRARAALGSGRLLAPEQGVVLTTDPVEARRIARAHLAFYLRAPNYTNNWLRLGYTPDDLAAGGSDRLVDALIAWGDVEAIRERVAAHLSAGADHVCLQVLTADPAAWPREEWRTLAAVVSHVTA